MSLTNIVKASIGIFLGSIIVSSVDAQWLNQPDKGIPRLKDGKPNLSAPAPRASNGKRDLTGVWEAQASVPGEVRRVIREVPFRLIPDSDIFESICAENERDRQHLEK